MNLHVGKSAIVRVASKSIESEAIQDPKERASALVSLKGISSLCAFVIKERAFP